MTASSSIQSNNASEAATVSTITQTGKSAQTGKSSESGKSGASVKSAASCEPAAEHVPLAPASKSGDYAFLGATPGSVADAFYMAAAEDWCAAINSRFVNELLDDTLPDSVLISYLIQDFTFFTQPTLERLTAQAPALMPESPSDALASVSTTKMNKPTPAMLGTSVRTMASSDIKARFISKPLSA